MDCKKDKKRLLKSYDGTGHRQPSQISEWHFNLNENDVVADIGAAEGNFSLSVIEKVKKLYILNITGNG